MYLVCTWSENSPSPDSVGLGDCVYTSASLEDAKQYAETHAYDHDGGLYVVYPDGTVDTGLELVPPVGDRRGKFPSCD